VAKALFDGIVETDYGQFDLLWRNGLGFDGDFDRFFAGQVNGLVGAGDPEGVYMHFGRRSGGSRVRIERCDAQPPLENQWEDIVEVSIAIPLGADPRWESWACDTSGPLGPIPAGTYRIRVSEKGRDEGHDSEFADGIVDSYLIQMWPAPPVPDAVIRVGSADAEYWHKEIGGRR
jgi:hypothetical protein